MSGPWDEDFLGHLRATRLIIVVRVPHIEDPGPLIESLCRAGAPIVEITFSVDNALEVISASSSEPALVGAGTVLAEKQARAAIDHGARFLVTPTTDPAIARIGAEAGVPVILGAFTPTEVVAAWRAGATAVKVFPAAVGGPRLVRELRAPLEGIPLVPSGGISAADAVTYLDAGALAVSAGSSVVAAEAVQTGDWRLVEERAAELVGAVAAHRAAWPLAP